jgi:UDP-N-acetyl-alpha-D-quinovosamine dehydrogenase
MRALVTGAGGFVGAALVDRLGRDGWIVRAIGRGAAALPGGIECEDLAAAESDRLDDWFDGIDVVFHLAGRAHRRDVGTQREHYEAYRHDNVATTVALFAAAQRNRATRFVYLSTIKVLGDVSREPFGVDDTPDPRDVYAQTKLEAERHLQYAQLRGATAVTIVRPPLIYGPGVAGNLHALLWLVANRVPLPLGCANAPRSLLALANLLDLLLCATADAAPFRVLHARDDEDCTVAELVVMLAQALERRPLLVSVPRSLMRLVLALLRRRDLYQRLFQPCQVDDSATRESLGWRPVVSRSDAFGELAAWWRTPR